MAERGPHPGRVPAASPVVLGIDVGLSGARGVVAAADGRVLGASDRVPVALATTEDRAELDMAACLEAAVRAGRETMARSGLDAVDAVGIAALGPAPLLVDDALAPLTPALPFHLDRRADGIRRDLGAASGVAVPGEHALPKARWWAEHQPGVAGRAAWVLDAAGFLVASLTGVPVIDRITLVDHIHAGVRPPIPLPPVAEPIDVVGGLTTAAAARLGLPSGTPVVAGTYDCWADLTAAGATMPGTAALVLGSTFIVGCIRESPPEPALGLLDRPGVAGGVIVGGWTTSGGVTLDWARALLGGADPEELERAAALLPPAAGGLLFLPYLAGERSPIDDPAARGAFVGLRPDTGAPELVRAVIDGLALSVRDHVERLRATGQVPPRWRVRGGVTRNRALVQALADATGLELELPSDATVSLGPCALALLGIGARLAGTTAEVVLPDPRRGRAFDDLYPRYRDLHPSIAATVHALAGIAQRAEVPR